MRPVVGPRDDSYTGICLFSLIVYETRLSASASVVGVQRLGLILCANEDDGMEQMYECRVVVISVHSDFSKREVIPLCAEAACLTCSLCFICMGDGYG